MFSGPSRRPYAEKLKRAKATTKISNCLLHSKKYALGTGAQV